MIKKLTKCLTGIPKNDVPALSAVLQGIAKTVNRKLTDKAYLEAFGDFWATCCAYPKQPPVRGMEFMEAVQLEFFNKLRATLAIRLSNGKLSDVRLPPELFDPETEEFRDLTPEELDRVAFRGGQIKLRGQSGDVISHDAPNGAFFTVRDLMGAVEETERQTRGRTEWFGSIDDHHLYLEGIKLTADGVWEICWGS